MAPGHWPSGGYLPGNSPPGDRKSACSGYLSLMASICSGGALLIRTTGMVGGQALEQLVQQGLRIFRPPQDQDMLRGFNGFQTFLLAKLAFNEDRGHGGGHQGQADNADHHEDDAHQPAQAKVTGTTSPYPTVVRVTRPHQGPPAEALHQVAPSPGSARAKPMAPSKMRLTTARIRPKTLSRCRVLINEVTFSLTTAPEAGRSAAAPQSSQMRIIH